MTDRPTAAALLAEARSLCGEICGMSPRWSAVLTRADELVAAIDAYNAQPPATRLPPDPLDEFYADVDAYKSPPLTGDELLAMLPAALGEVDWPHLAWYMREVGWQWEIVFWPGEGESVRRVPTVEDLRRTAERLMRGAIEAGVNCVASGGIVAHVDRDDRECPLWWDFALDLYGGSARKDFPRVALDAAPPAARTAPVAPAQPEAVAAAPVGGLMPCPFCGQPQGLLGNRWVNKSGTLVAAVSCDRCTAEVYALTRDEADARWNRRAHLPPAAPHDPELERFEAHLQGGGPGGWKP